MIASKRWAGHSRLLKQVNWRHPKIVQSDIDQTELVIVDAPTGATPFSFGVIGDTDADLSAGQPTFAEAFAQQLMQNLGESHFLLHTGDVAYPMGSYQSYLSGFLRPYRAFLSKGLEHCPYRGDSVVFNRPLLPVPGNHDYDDLPGAARWRHGLLRFLGDRLRQHLNIDIGCYGGYGGEAYGQTFLDNLSRLSAEQLTTHLATHYDAICSMSDRKATARGLGHSAQSCLSYQPGRFTRLPNRYYRFRYGGVDFFALDSNTWNSAPEAAEFDHEQLSWLERGLVTSWQTPETIGRIVYLHHSPYTTEKTRWQQPETLWVRRHLRSVLNRVAARLNRTGLEQPEMSGFSSSRRALPKSPLVDLVISGHAHCLEHIRTTNTGHADAGLDWVVCGGSGVSLRPQRPDSSADILERLTDHTHSSPRRYTSVVAQSQRYISVGGSQLQGHSFIRVDVNPNCHQKFVVRPFVVTKNLQDWQTRALNTLTVGTAVDTSLPVGSR
ncbi:MAG: metallophosphoesterase [Phormidesmis sp.]